eukprot:995686_1
MKPGNIVYKDRFTGDVIVSSDHDLSETVPGLIECSPKTDVLGKMVEVSMDKDSLKEFLASYYDDTLEVLGNDNAERENFERSAPVMKEFLLDHAYTDLKFYANQHGFENADDNRFKNISLAFGYRDG